MKIKSFRNRKIKILLVLFVFIFVTFDMFITPKNITSEFVQINNKVTTQKTGSLVIQEKQNSGFIWANNGYTVYMSSDGGNVYKRQFKVPVPLTSISYLGNSKTFRRLFHRYEFLELKILKSGTFLIFADGKIYRSVDSGKHFEIVHKLKHFGRGVGRGVMPSGIAEDIHGNVYYGEYFRNNNKEAANIYRSVDDGKTWEVFYTFKAGLIRHIHALQYDRYTDTLWVASGDKDNENLLGYFPGNKNVLKVVCSGSQSYRAVSLIFTRDDVYWGMDSPDIQNYIYRYDRNTHKIEQLQPINGPVYYSTIMKNGRMFFGTTREGGKGEWDNQVSVWTSIDGRKWDKVLNFCGVPDSHSYTVIRFPRGECKDELIINLLNAKDYSNDILIIKDRYIK